MSHSNPIRFAPQSPTAHKALGLLSHPFSIGAMAVMLLNDLALRRLVPSWWTGKLSDVAYLFFMPFALAALLAWLLPRLSERRARGLAFTLTALLFTLGKLHPAINAALGDMLQSTLGLPIHITADPTDLLALPALAASWILWQRQPELPRLRVAQPGQNARWLLLPLAAFLTLANAAPPSYGITCLGIQGRKITASGYYAMWTSADGGLTWQEQGMDQYAAFCHHTDEEKLLAIPGTDTRYRYKGSAIERSDDGGGSWQLAYRSPAFHDSERAYYEKTSSADDSYADIPIDAIYDAPTGNVIFSMGHQGVLVRTASGAWQWAAVGPYQRRALEQGGLQAYFILLQGELALAAGAALLMFSSLALPRLKKKWYLVGKLIIGWLVFGFAAVVIPPAITNGTYINLLSYFALLAAVIWAFLSAMIDAILLFRTTRPALGRTALFALWAAPAYFLPYLLWSANVLPYYYLAVLLAAILLGLVIARGRSGSLPARLEEF